MKTLRFLVQPAMRAGLGMFSAVAFSAAVACPVFAQDEPAAEAAIEVAEVVQEEPAAEAVQEVPAVEAVQEPAAEAVQEEPAAEVTDAQPVQDPAVVDPMQDTTTEEAAPFQDPFNCPNRMLWYMGDVYVYEIGTCEPVQGGCINKPKEGEPQIVSFAKQIQTGSKQGEDGQYNCAVEEPVLSEVIELDPTGNFGYDSSNTDFRTSLFKAGDKHYRSVYFTANGSREDGNRLAWQYRVAFPIATPEDGFGENAGVSGNECVVEGNTLVVKGASEDSEAERYEIFSGTFVGVPEEIVVQEDPSVQPVEDTMPAEDTAQPADEAVVQPAEGDAVQPAEGDAVQPAEGDAVQPAEGDAVQPADGDATQPADGGGN